MDSHQEIVKNDSESNKDNNDVVLRTENLKKIYKKGTDQEVNALRGVDITIKRGEMVSIMGSSGSGKTTLLNIIGGLDVPSEGFVYIDNQDIGKMSDKHWMPHFSCKTLGDALLDIMHHYGKDYELTVLCGHNHTFWESNPLHNIRCITGQAQYRNPQVCGVFQI